MHILVVEDEKTLCDTIARSLRRLAYSVDCCYDGEKALELLGVERYDLVMLDLKEIDEEKHKELTGYTNQNILEMAKFLSDNGTDMWIRHVLVPGLTDDPEGLKRTREFIDSLKTVKRVEVLPYHTLGKFKWEKLGIAYPLEGVRTPTEEEVKTAEELLGIVK